MPQEAATEKNDHGNTDKSIDLTIKATNGEPWETDKFKPRDKVEKVLRKAVKHFVASGAMAEGEYNIALVVGDIARPLNPNDRLKDAGVKDKAVLVLTPKPPQVDG